MNGKKLTEDEFARKIRKTLDKKKYYVKLFLTLTSKEKKMITVMKSHGATSTAKGKQHEGSKGRLELFACRVRDGDEEGFELRFLDYGNYGRQRWEANFGFLDDYDIRGMIDSLHALLHDKIETTHISHEQTTDEATSNEDNNTTENFPETSANAVEVNNERVSEQSL